MAPAAVKAALSTQIEGGLERPPETVPTAAEAGQQPEKK